MCQKFRRRESLTLRTRQGDLLGGGSYGPEQVTGFVIAYIVSHIYGSLSSHGMRFPWLSEVSEALCSFLCCSLFACNKIFTSKNDASEDESKSKGTQAKELLTRYGGAYLATSISLSAISFGLCYVLVSSGIDVASLLQKIGIQSNETGEKVGTFALAYAAHKAASPIRFPPTVALTPVVASWFGKKGTEAKEEEKL